MIGSWLTTRAVFVLGALMVLVGLLFVSNGVPIVRLEIGWTQIIGGSVAASAGCIVLVLGVFLQRLEAMQESLDRLAVAPATELVAPEGDALFAATEAADAEEDAQPEPAARIKPPHPLAPTLARARFEPSVGTVRPEPALAVAPPPEEGEEAPPPPRPPVNAPTLDQGAPALVRAEASESHSPVIDTLVGPEPPRQRAGFLDAIRARRSAAALRTTEPAPPVVAPAEVPVLRPSLPEAPADEVPAAPAPALSAGEEGGDRPIEDAGSPAPEPVRAAPGPEATPDVPAVPGEAAAEPPQPVVVGRYNAGSASYIMYSNGMIEVETEQGTHQFASMQELKAFIERRDTSARVY